MHLIKFEIQKPVDRSAVRKILGREYFILKRYYNRMKEDAIFAEVNDNISFNNSVVYHRSLLLRPLRGVDMYLQHNKVVNLRLAISCLNNTVIKPGEIFSFWKLVGRPTKKKGYIDGLTLDNGIISKGIGGGLCQLSNLIYWMALHTPLNINERWRHSYDVFPDINRTVPFGCGATLAYNYIDLQLKNSTDYSFQLKLWLDNEFLNGEITCSHDNELHYEIFETDHCFKSQWWGGYSRHNRIWKRITNKLNNDQKVEPVSVNNAILMYEPLLN